MKSIYELKPAFQRLLRPLNRRLTGIGLNANHITIIALALSVFTGIAVAIWPQQRCALLAVPLVLFIRMALNAIDGMLAREHDMKSSLGAVLNELGDVFSDVAIYLPFCLINGIKSWLVVMIVIAGVVVEMAGVVAVQIGAERRYDGPMGKSDRAFVFGFIAFAAGLGFSLEPWVNIVLAGVLILSAVTIVNRVRGALKEVS
ncbi:MAG: CDP-alcohol phosphatidyltransferase [marine bacterium B5-7]|nr:MAG: CDP-alcohol phosphatidyltransferase [marine bacterium B5-7]